MKRLAEIIHERPWVAWILFLGTVVAVFLVALFAASIVERRSEAQVAVGVPVTPLPEFEPRNAVWGEQFRRQFETYLNTLDTTFASKYGGARKRDMLANHPEKVVLWAGYAFARDYNQIRGHYYSVYDVNASLRTAIPQPATCWTCKSTDVPRLMHEHGPDGFYAQTWADLGPEVVNPIGCQDCHDPSNMRLRITRPALIEAFERMGMDIEQATHQEMRSLVCAQCHVEYYFRKEDNYLIFPWDRGTNAEEIEAHLDSINHVDWVHALSRAPMIKVQHPDWELFRTGIHAYRGVSCADCHMPYRREGGIKFTDHHIQSPLNNISASCMVCHGGSEQEMLDRVYSMQDKIYELRRTAERLLAAAHIEAKTAWDNGATEQQMEPILRTIRSAQWRWDWIAASHGASFHAPGESGRLLGSAINRAAEARLSLSRVFADLGVSQPIQMPDISTKEAAQRYIGLNMEDIRRQKAEFLRNILPEWERQAAERQAGPTDYVPSPIRGGR